MIKTEKSSKIQIRNNNISKILNRVSVKLLYKCPTTPQIKIIVLVMSSFYGMELNMGKEIFADTNC